MHSSQRRGDREIGSPRRHPLADLMRPDSLSDVVGQSHLLRRQGPIGSMIASGKLSSMVLWGPPGVGKTTIARLLTRSVNLEFVQISAIFSRAREIKDVFSQAEERRRLGAGTLLFVDEIHRFNKSQQDGFLPLVEDGTIVLVGATTENPSFELNAALLSRLQVFTLRRLDHEALASLAGRAETRAGRQLPLERAARQGLLEMADGDGRALLNSIELLFEHAGEASLDTRAMADLLAKRAPVYDKAGDSHYNLISALHKSVRGSDPDAALYWLARMLNGGEDPRFIARRATRMAVEDVGLADPSALGQCLEAWQAFERLGSPEGDLALAQAIVYLALAPKSNAVYKSLKAAVRHAGETGSLPPPKRILNAPTKLMKQEDYGAGYRYDHDEKEGFSGQNYFPDGMARPSYYKPVERGFEREMAKRMAYFSKLRRRKGGN
ncbi:MAG: replication-associated recombination protein A [Albidovulum sp.]|nr:replication-associated recombination protein A [Albidovulum sp.]